LAEDRTTKTLPETESGTLASLPFFASSVFCVWLPIADFFLLISRLHRDKKEAAQRGRLPYWKGGFLV
jgi:hypothetical protein